MKAGQGQTFGSEETEVLRISSGKGWQCIPNRAGSWHSLISVAAHNFDLAQKGVYVTEF